MKYVTTEYCCRDKGMASNYNHRKILTKLLVLKFLAVLALLLICHPTITSCKLTSIYVS